MSTNQTSFTLIRLSSSFVVALVATGVRLRRILVELILLYQWLGRRCRFVQINFEVIGFVLEILELFLDELNFVFVVGYGGVGDAAGGECGDLDASRFPVVGLFQGFGVADSDVFTANLLVV
jgi:hypothetical protein